MNQWKILSFVQVGIAIAILAKHIIQTKKELDRW